MRPNSAAADLVRAGIELLEARRPVDARRRLEEAVRLDRRFILAWLNLGVACSTLGDLKSAGAAFLTAAGLDPDSAEAQHGLGLVSAHVSDFERAELYLRRAISLKPMAGYYNNLSIVLRLVGRSEESDDALRQALELAPDDAAMHSNFLLHLGYTQGDGAVMRAEHEEWWRRHGAKLVQRAPEDFAERDRDSDRRIRVAYLSADFRQHSVAYFMEGLLAAHDPSRVDVVCYADVRTPDAWTARLRAFVPTWVDVTSLDDESLTRRIVADDIDILVDLNGHTGMNRLPVFARRAAPIQVSYLGYIGTTGLHTMDYRLTDEETDPTGLTDPFYTERLVRLAGGMWCYQGDTSVPVAPAPPRDRNGFVTFGSFNHLPKITDALLSTWVRVLSQIPESRLYLKAMGLASESAHDALRARFVAQGGDAARLTLLPPASSIQQHLERYNDIDVALDSFPYNGITTTCEALWMGVPVVTWPGNAPVSRVAAGMLANAGLGSLVAASPDDYIRRAVDVAQDAAALRDLKRSMRRQFQSSPLMSGPRLAREMERAFRDMWRAWCANPSVRPNGLGDGRAPTA